MKLLYTKTNIHIKIQFVFRVASELTPVATLLLADQNKETNAIFGL